MFRTRIVCGVLAGFLCLGLAFPAMAAEVRSGEEYCFSQQDFGSTDLAGICILQVPETGSVRLGSRRVMPGDVLTAQQLERMVFCPADSETDTHATISYLPICSEGVAQTAAMDITVMGRQDKPPVAEDSALETYKNLPGEAMLKVQDPENQPLTYTIVRQPRRGEVNIRSDGSFLYEPKKNKVGIDSFTFTATDPAGNVSREATVTITILKPSDARQYSDTTGADCRFAAEWMKNTGIFVGENLGGNSCFRPERQVSRGEFLTMLVGALNIPVEEDAELTGFADEAPAWLKPYLAAAMRSGLTAGWPNGDVFAADQPITGAEAAVMLQNVLDLPVPQEQEASAMAEQIPDWAKKALSALANRGICMSAAEPLTRGQAANVLYQASQLTDTAAGMTIVRIANRNA